MNCTNQMYRLYVFVIIIIFTMLKVCIVIVCIVINVSSLQNVDIILDEMSMVPLLMKITNFQRTNWEMKCFKALFVVGV